MPAASPQHLPATRIAIVTGGAQGIGEAIALRLADDGLDVAIFDLPVKLEQLEAVARSIEAKGRRCLVGTGDVTLEKDVAAMIDKTVHELGGLDVMIANAGVFWQKSFLESTLEEWNEMLSVNTIGVMLCFKYAALQMIKQGRGGRIIGAASVSAKQGFANASAYCASKFAVRGLAQSLALELMQYNITVNTYAPGLVNTPMVQRPEDKVNGGPASTIKKVSGLPSTTPVATPSVIAELVSYMAKPESSFLNGQCVNINGGIVME